MTPAEDEARRQRGHEVVLLKDRWDERFADIGHDGTCYVATDRRTGRVFRHSTALGLGQELWSHVADGT